QAASPIGTAKRTSRAKSSPPVMSMAIPSTQLAAEDATSRSSAPAIPRILHTDGRARRDEVPSHRAHRLRNHARALTPSWGVISRGAIEAFTEVGRVGFRSSWRRRVGVDDAGAEFLGEIAAACVEVGVGGRLDAGLDLAVGAVGGGDEECGCGRD